MNDTPTQHPQKTQIGTVTGGEETTDLQRILLLRWWSWFKRIFFVSYN